MTDKRRPFRLVILAFALALTGCADLWPLGERNGGSHGAMVAAADPRAVEAGLAMLREGGTATDAAIATMMVLGLVEPQSAGVGGGGFLMHYDAGSEDITAYDGRERAPAGAEPGMFLDENGQPMFFISAAHSGRAIGTPSLIAMLKLAHDEHGKLAWARLFEPAIALAEAGFEVSPRLHTSIERAGADMKDDPEARAYFFTEDGAPLPVGFVRTNPAYAATLRAIAEEGPRVLRQGPVAEAIVAAAQREPRAGALTLGDLQDYRPRRLAPLCGPFRTYAVCSMPSPSSGGVAVISILGLYERMRPTPVGADDPDDWAAFLWASRLAYADRDYYMADDEYVPVPANDLIAPAYLDARAQGIDLAHAPRGVAHGDPASVVGGESYAARWGSDATPDNPGTTHLSIVDRAGNAVALTATVEAPFGAQRMTHGFLLNNQLTDFSLRPEVNGKPVANAVAPGKRPRSSMAPTIVTDGQGQLVAVVGSPGGSGIIAYVARTLIGALAWRQTMQEAIATGHVVGASAPARIEATLLPEGLQSALEARGWRMQAIASEQSGLHAIRVTPYGLQGGADPRREGVARMLD